MAIDIDPKDLLFIGTYGSVKAIDKWTGEDRWQTSLPGTGYGIISLLCEEFLLIAGSKGHVFGIDARSGQILWSNPLPGLGNEDMCLAVQTSTARAASSPPKTVDDPVYDPARSPQRGS